VAQRVSRGIALHFHDRGTRRGEWSAAGPGRTLPPEKHGIHFTGGWVGLWTHRKSRPHRDSITDRPARSAVAILTALPGPHQVIVTKRNLSCDCFRRICKTSKSDY